MKLIDLNMKCGDCELIDYCNSYEDTPPCAQPRFSEVEVYLFKTVAENYLISKEIFDYMKETLEKQDEEINDTQNM